jgi:3',5'-cyclic AMP phosphodiesterase CpdA
MSWLLHLSDPHLGDVSPLDDEKMLFDQPDLETAQRVFKRTLRTLSEFVKKHEKPSVVVVSGDITYHSRDAGFEAFAALLDDYADILPDDRSKIMVVPGNHDVVWKFPAGDPRRYEGFLRATRAQGCATPLLDGVDFAADDEEGTLLADTGDLPHLIADGDDMLVIPINSSNYCGTLVDLRGGWTAAEWDTALAPLVGDAKDEAMKQLDRLRRHDISRVSRPQVAALARLFAHVAEAHGKEPGDHRVRIAVLHHQLLPVSTREERTSFESIVNLGLVRETLRAYGVELVLHGHKHESGIYWDVAKPPDTTFGAAARQMLVISSPGEFDVGAPVMRALRLTGGPYARSLRLSTFLGSSHQRRRAQIAPDEPRVPLWLSAMDAESAERTVVRGSTAHVAYSRLQGLRQVHDPEQPTRNLVCQIDDPSDAAQLPPDYPSVGSARSQAWFEDMVTWWQLERSQLVERNLLGFNHGERIYKRWGNQVKRAAHLLDLRPDSSRALVQLVAPRETGRYPSDERPMEDGSFPAFVLAELSITKRDGYRHLDCFGYFRKQELRYWWPVNVAELARLQQAVWAELPEEKRPKIGRIVTFSAIALWADALPRVAVPEIDRLVDEPDRLWSLAAAIAHPSSADADTAAEWERILADLAGDGRKRPPQPKLGIARLLLELDRVATVATSTHLDPVRAALKNLATQHEAHADGELNEAAAKLVKAAVDELRTAVERALSYVPSTTPPAP